MGFCDLEGPVLGGYRQQDERFELGGIFMGVQAERKRAPLALEQKGTAGAAFGERVVGLRRQFWQKAPRGIDIVDQTEAHAILR